MLANIDFNEAEVIVELGPGTGVITKELVKQIQPSCKLLVFELHHPFYESLNKEFKHHENVIIIYDSAEMLKKYLIELKLDKADVILSSLPLANFKKILLKKLLTEAKNNLKEKGLFIQFQYSLRTKKILRSYFPDINTAFTTMNFPPAFVFTCEKKQTPT